MVSKYYKIKNKSGGNNSLKPFQLYLCVYGLAFGLFLNSAMQIILEIWLVATIVMCGVVTTIEGTQRSKRFFLTLEYKDFTHPGITMMFCRGLELLKGHCHRLTCAVAFILSETCYARPPLWKYR